MTSIPSFALADRTGMLPVVDLFNGDADGICSLHQLRMAEPRAGRLVSGVKRDIDLFGQLGDTDPPSDITVLDVSFDRNEAGVRRALQAGGRVRYFDHHSARSLFHHPRLESHIDPSAVVCTSLLVDRTLAGRFHEWAIVGAFGDNLLEVARSLCAQRGLTLNQTASLEQLGQLLNYNAYGEAVEDLHFSPIDLYRVVHNFESPFGFIADADEYRHLAAGRADDQHHLEALAPYWRSIDGDVYLLPGTAWARRLSGTLANRLSCEEPHRSFAVLTPRSDGHFLVSVRCPAQRKSAQALCCLYPGGGGRHAAAGIDRLPVIELEQFIADFSNHITGKPS
ncbi:hypothetical protein [Rhizobacter sp. P5_C2]